MKKFLTALIVLQLLSLTAFSQGTFPRWENIDGVNVYCFTKDQLKEVRKVYAERDQYSEISDSLICILGKWDSIIFIQKQIIASDQREINNYKKIETVSQMQITSLQSIIADDKKTLKMQRLKTGIFQGTTAVSIIAILILLL